MEIRIRHYSRDNFGTGIGHDGVTMGYVRYDKSNPRGPSNRNDFDASIKLSSVSQATGRFAHATERNTQLLDG